MKSLTALFGLILLAILVGGSTYLDPVDAPRYQSYGTTFIDGQRNATFSAVVGTSGSYSGPVSAANLTTSTAVLSANANFPANTGDLFVSGTTTIWLPAAAQTPIGRHFTVWNVGSNTVTMAATGSDTLQVFGGANPQAGSKHSMDGICRTSSSWIIRVI